MAMKYNPQRKIQPDGWPSSEFLLLRLPLIWAANHLLPLLANSLLLNLRFWYPFSVMFMFIFPPYFHFSPQPLTRMVCSPLNSFHCDKMANTFENDTLDTTSWSTTTSTNSNASILHFGLAGIRGTD